MPQTDYTSVMDKTDWKRVIQETLDRAVNSIGVGSEETFYQNVEQAIAALSATYPNWDAYEEVKKGVKAIKDEYRVRKEQWIEEHRTYYALPWNRGIADYRWDDSMYLDILDFLKNLAGRHRMLLYGKKKELGKAGEVKWTDKGRPIQEEDEE